MTDDEMKTERRDALTALIRAAADFAYSVANQIKRENSENAKALAVVLDNDPAAEFIASVRLSPDRRVALSLATGGQTHVIYESGAVEVTGVRH